MGETTIEWTDRVWNPVTGCTKVSQGCKHCYAERVFPRTYAKTGRKFVDVAMHPDRLEMPLRWKKPRRIFVNSMSDLFHEDVPAAFVAQVFAVMRMAPQHTFQVLTKRPERMLELLTRAPEMPRDVLPNVWLGVSVEDQATANERIPLLLKTPAAVRWISAEPLLGPVHVGPYLSRTNMPGLRLLPNFRDPLPGLDWVVVGGESGRHGRPFDIAWARSMMAHCRAAGVPVLIKQLGVDPRWNGISSPEEPGWPTGIPRNDTGEGNWRPMLRDRKGGNMAEWPEDLRVREYPG